MRGFYKKIYEDSSIIERSNFTSYFFGFSSKPGMAHNSCYVPALNWMLNFKQLFYTANQRCIVGLFTSSASKKVSPGKNIEESIELKTEKFIAEEYGA